MAETVRNINLMTAPIAVSPSEAYRRLADFKAYPQYAEAVQHVDVLEDDHPWMVSAWTVRFRDGILRWTERDEFCPDELEIRFEQVAGDVETFLGKWAVHSHADGTVVQFLAALDLGIPSLASILNPIAEQALVENIRSILSGLFRDAVPFEVSPATPDRVADLVRVPA